jgi:hypothetical protein
MTAKNADHAFWFLAFLDNNGSDQNLQSVQVSGSQSRLFQQQRALETICLSHQDECGVITGSRKKEDEAAGTQTRFLDNINRLLASLFVESSDAIADPGRRSST